MTNTLTKTQQGSCPVCLTQNGTYYISVKEFKIYKCSKCGLEHTHPIPSESQLKDFYSTYSDIRAASDVVAQNAKRNLKLLDTFGYSESKTLLDFGTGNADFVKVAGENCFGVDFKAANSPRCYSKLNDLPIKNFDFVTLWGVLEHLANPIEVLSEVKNFLKPNGVVAITTVDAEGPIPYYYKPVEHLTYWTKSSFEHLFERTGIQLIEYQPYKMIQRSEVYVDRLLSRTPTEYKSAFSCATSALPEYIEIPTNEVLVIGKYTS